MAEPICASAANDVFSHEGQLPLHGASRLDAPDQVLKRPNGFLNIACTVITDLIRSFSLLLHICKYNRAITVAGNFGPVPNFIKIEQGNTKFGLSTAEIAER
jgi:hypothetical protein